MTVIAVFTTASCRIKPEQLPYLAYPYLYQIEFLKHVENHNDKAKKEYFKDGVIRVPFYFLLTVNELEDEGTIWVRLYNSDGKRVVEQAFYYGESGKYYEYIICFERVEWIPPGPYRYTVFYDDGLIYEGSVTVREPKSGT